MTYEQPCMVFHANAGYWMSGKVLSVDDEKKTAFVFHWGTYAEYYPLADLRPDLALPLWDLIHTQWPPEKEGKGIHELVATLIEVIDCAAEPKGLVIDA